MKNLFRACGLLLLAGAISLSWGGEALAQSQSDSTYFMPRYQVRDTTEVESTEMTLREIIERCVEGEKSKLMGHTDMTYNATIRTIIEFKNKKEFMDEFYRVYEEDSGFVRFVNVDEIHTKLKRDGDQWVPDEKDDEEDPEFEEESFSAGSDFNDIPFFLEEFREFDFELVERNLLEDRVIFKIKFKPKSDFKPLPSGTVYVDTERFRIIHEEFRFDNNPFPLLIGKINRVSRHWKELPGGEWVTHKLLFDMDLKGSWTGVIPKKVSGVIIQSDYVFDQGYDERVLGAR